MPKSRKVVTVNDQPSKTVQADIQYADINTVIRSFPGIQITDHLQEVDQVFMDVSEFTDYADLRIQTAAATEEFMKLPSKVREVFGHDVYNWLDAAHDPEKREALRPQFENLGILKPKEKNVPMDSAPVEGPGGPSTQGDTSPS